MQPPSEARKAPLSASLSVPGNVSNHSADACTLDCLDKNWNCRLVIGLIPLLAFAQLLYMAIHSWVRPGEGDAADVCEAFRDFEGRVFCGSDEVKHYAFHWGNSACSGVLPSVVVRAASEKDVSHAVKLSAALGKRLSYRSGGHSYICDSIMAESVHIDLRAMKSRRLYQEGDSWYAQFGTGNTFKDLFRLIDRKRFSIVHGACHAVGVGGFYLHGGLHLNSLTALYGWGNETVTNMTVVTASGDVLNLSKTSLHNDLWRAMLRSGSNFGIATSLTVRVFERPEPLFWLFWARMSHSDAIILFQKARADPQVQLNLYFVNPPFFQISSNRSETFTFQFSLLNGSTAYKKNFKQSVKWFKSQGFPLSRYTRSFNALVPKPDDLTSLGYPKSWTTSHAIWPASSECTLEAQRFLLHKQSQVIKRARMHSFLNPGCWLTFSRLPADQIYYEYTCPSESTYVKHLQDVEIQFGRICPHFVKYRNTPNNFASVQRYFPDYRELLQIKQRWDPQFFFGPATYSLRDLKHV